MPILRCDAAVEFEFGGSKFRWLVDDVSGYNQICIADKYQHKPAFAGPNCSKYAMRVGNAYLQKKAIC